MKKTTYLTHIYQQTILFIFSYKWFWGDLSVDALFIDKEIKTRQSLFTEKKVDDIKEEIFSDYQDLLKMKLNYQNFKNRNSSPSIDKRLKHTFHRRKELINSCANLLEMTSEELFYELEDFYDNEPLKDSFIPEIHTANFIWETCNINAIALIEDYIIKKLIIHLNQKNHKPISKTNLKYVFREVFKSWSDTDFYVLLANINAGKEKYLDGIRIELLDDPNGTVFLTEDLIHKIINIETSFFYTPLKSEFQGNISILNLFENNPIKRSLFFWDKFAGLNHSEIKDMASKLNVKTEESLEIYFQSIDETVNREYYKIRKLSENEK